MNIRTMTIDDYHNVYALWLRTPGMGLNDVDDSYEGMHRYLRRNPTSCFVAEVHEHIAGVILCGHDGRRGYINHLAVDPAYRRIGIASQLLQRAVTALEAEGIIKAALVVFAHNTSGNAFWERQGFTIRTDIHYRNRTLTSHTRITP